MSNQPYNNYSHIINLIVNSIDQTQHTCARAPLFSSDNYVLNSSNYFH